MTGEECIFPCQARCVSAVSPDSSLRRDARQELSAPCNTVQGDVAVVVVASVAYNAVSETLALFSVKYPHVTLLITDGYTSELLLMQWAGQLDLVVINESAKRDEYQQIDLIFEDLAVVGPTDMAMPDDEIGFETIDHRRLVIRRHGGLQAVLDETAQPHGVKLLSRYESDEINTIENFIVNTGFQTILSPLAVANAPRSGAFAVRPIVAAHFPSTRWRASHRPAALSRGDDVCRGIAETPGCGAAGIKALTIVCG
jgi:DNA-binding transcriptional LysR family regulator